MGAGMGQRERGKEGTQCAPYLGPGQDEEAGRREQRRRAAVRAAAALRARRGELEAAEAVVGVAGCPSAPFKGVRGGGGRARRWRLGERRGAP